MSTPNQGPSRNPINRVTAWASRLNNRRRGTSMLKAAYAQARRDVKQMDPGVRERIGRANLTAADLQSLSVAHIQGEYGSSAQAAYSQRLDAIATGRVQEAGPSAPPTKNPIRWLANWDSRRRDRKQGTAVLKAAYAQARRDVKQMDPAVREQIGQARITKAELQHLAQTKMNEVIRPELRQNAAAPAQAQPQAGQAQGQTAQVQGQAAQVQGQAQGAPGAAPQAARPTVAQRIGQAAGTVSRWAQTAWSATTTAARQAAQAFTAARQNPEADPRTTEAWNSPGYTGREGQVAGQQTGSAERQSAAYEPTGKHPIVSEQATSEAVASEPATDQQVTGEPAAKQDVEVASDPHATDAANGAATKDVASKVERPVTLADMNNVRAAFSGVSAARIDPNAVKAAATQTNASTENNRGQQTTRETDHTTGR
jgi:hypothetical protein